MPTEPTNPPPRSPGSLRPPVLPLLPGLARPPGSRQPLPDAGGVRRLVVPDSAPPYDDELRPAPGAPPRRPRPRPPGPEGRGVPDGPDRRDVPGRPESRDGRDAPGAASRAARPARGPDPADGWPGQFAQVLAETLAGSRPARQIVPWTTIATRQRIRQLGPTLMAGQRPLVRRVVTAQPAAGVVEMTVVVSFGARTRALAVRLERDRERQPGRWLCTAIEAA